MRNKLGFADIAKMITAKEGAWAAYFGQFRPSEVAYVLQHLDKYLVRWARRNANTCAEPLARPDGP
ncbi:MAG: hypothetical protein LC775_11410 [Acidobacteria bacterium]|nr:hypothetical protein [Acidobacteriota bacterium]